MEKLLTEIPGPQARLPLAFLSPWFGSSARHRLLSQITAQVVWDGSQAWKLPLPKACDELVILIHVTTFVMTENQERVQFAHPWSVSKRVSSTEAPQKRSPEITQWAKNCRREAGSLDPQPNVDTRSHALVTCDGRGVAWLSPGRLFCSSCNS